VSHSFKDRSCKISKKDASKINERLFLVCVVGEAICKRRPYKQKHACVVLCTQLNLLCVYQLQIYKNTFIRDDAHLQRAGVTPHQFSKGLKISLLDIKIIILRQLVLNSHTQHKYTLDTYLKRLRNEI